MREPRLDGLASFHEARDAVGSDHVERLEKVVLGFRDDVAGDASRATLERSTRVSSNRGNSTRGLRWRMLTSRITALALFAFLAGGAAACGSDDERLTARELAERGNAVCRDVDKEFEDAFSEFDDDEEPTAAEMQEFASIAADITDGAIGRFEELEPPEDLEASWNDTLEKARAAQKALEEAGEDPESAQALFSSEEDPFDEVNAGLEKVGITVCSDDE